MSYDQTTTEDETLSLYRGDDTNFQGEGGLKISLEGIEDTENCKAEFSLQSVMRTFTEEEVASGELTAEYTAAETGNFYPGKCYGQLTLIDPLNRRRVAKMVVVDVKMHSPSNTAPKQEEPTSDGSGSTVGLFPPMP